jgi:CubicO group peptidase (beta-lactamase class C family)
MKRMFNTTMVELFGSMAANITVDNLFRMNSGLNDFECRSCNFDTQVLVNSTNTPQEVHSPMESFEYVASLGPFTEECKKTFECTFVCEPGTCFKYSTLNYMLGGLILVNFAPEGQDTWQTFD